MRSQAKPSYLAVKTLLTSEFGDAAFAACKPVVIHTLETASCGGAGTHSHVHMHGGGAALGAHAHGASTEGATAPRRPAAPAMQPYYVAPVQLATHLARAVQPRTAWAQPSLAGAFGTGAGASASKRCAGSIEADYHYDFALERRVAFS